MLYKVMMIATGLSMLVWTVILHFEITASAIIGMVYNGLALVLWVVAYKLHNE